MKNLKTNSGELILEMNAKDYYNNLRDYLRGCLIVLCEEFKIPEPPLLLINERYHSVDGWYSGDSRMIYIDIKTDDYVGVLLHEFAHYIGMNEVGAYEFESRNREGFQREFNKGMIT